MKHKTNALKSVKNVQTGSLVRQVLVLFLVVAGIFRCPEPQGDLTLLKSPFAAASAINPQDVLRFSRRRRTKKQRNNQDGIVACYARYSSDQQDEKSIVDQVRACRTHASGKNLVIDDHSIYKDEAVSGAVRDREGLDRLLADAAAGKIRVIYFYNLSRLAREMVITKTVMR